MCIILPVTWTHENLTPPCLIHKHTPNQRVNFWQSIYFSLHSEYVQLCHKMNTLMWAYICGGKKRHRGSSHFSGGVIVMVWAVNSSSKYLVSVSDVTLGLKGGTSWDMRRTQGGKIIDCTIKLDTAVSEYKADAWRPQTLRMSLKEEKMRKGK